MRYAAIVFISLALGVLACTPARAQNYKFTSTLTAPDVKIASITVTASDKVNQEKERWSSVDVDYLKRDLKKRVARILEHRGLIDHNNGVRLDLTILDVTPNRPTAQALTNRLALDFRSFGLGGAEIGARLVSRNGKELGEMHYRWKEYRLYQTSASKTVWFDAHRAFDKFSRHLVKNLQSQTVG